MQILTTIPARSHATLIGETFESDARAAPPELLVLLEADDRHKAAESMQSETGRGEGGPKPHAVIQDQIVSPFKRTDFVRDSSSQSILTQHCESRRCIEDPVPRSLQNCRRWAVLDTPHALAAMHETRRDPRIPRT